MTAEERRERHFKAAAENYLWGDYVNAGSEFEEVAALVKLLQETRSDALEEAAKVAERMLNGKGIAAAIRALGKQEK